MKIVTKSTEETQRIGEKLGRRLSGGELIELTGDLGTGKTVFIKGLAKGLGISQPISSPTFTISRVYQVNGKSFHHFDFYRIDSGDIVAMEITEAANDPDAIVVVEWAEHIKEALPPDFLAINLRRLGEDQREVIIEPHGLRYNKMAEDLE